MKDYKFKIAIEKCAGCDGPMMKKANRGIFPYYYKESQDAQMKAQGIHYISDSQINGDPICSKCETEGKASFVCEICKTEKPSSKLHESFGDPADYVCSDCYETIPAKEWDERTEEISERHRFDYC